jgi:hypothetical protein
MTRGGFHKAVYAIHLKFALFAHLFLNKFALIWHHAFGPCAELIAFSPRFWVRSTIYAQLLWNPPQTCSFFNCQGSFEVTKRASLTILKFWGDEKCSKWFSMFLAHRGQGMNTEHDLELSRKIYCHKCFTFHNPGIYAKIWKYLWNLLIF